MTTLPVGGFPHTQRKFLQTVGRMNTTILWGSLRLAPINYIQYYIGIDCGFWFILHYLLQIPFAENKHTTYTVHTYIHTYIHTALLVYGTA